MQGVKSEGMITNGGMPQASKVGPIAFIIKINDLSSLQNEGDGHDGWIIIFNVYGLKFVTSRVYWKLQRQRGLKIVKEYAIRHHKSGRTVTSVRKIEKMWCLQGSSKIFLLCDHYIRTRYSISYGTESLPIRNILRLLRRSSGVGNTWCFQLTNVGNTR